MIRSAIRCALVALAIFTSSVALAHPNLSEYVQHEVILEAGSTYIDLTVRLTFFDRYAELQAALLDRDSDGRFSSAEQIAYRQDLLDTVEGQVALYFGGRELPLVPLYEPELLAVSDIPGQRQQDFGVVLRFFARIPEGPRDDQILAVHDGLYPQFAALAAFHVAGKNGVRLSVVGDDHDLSRPADPEQPLVLRARMTADTTGATDPIPSHSDEKGAQG